ncbi:unnamed protein product [Meloidogyne enterolobii]|uniref:Uncharacterized protein n=1 Tax=Meloidogyne enterolobii TaxID=390850 RepID=A0ACB1A9J7_MELEN
MFLLTWRMLRVMRLLLREGQLKNRKYSLWINRRNRQRNEKRQKVEMLEGRILRRKSLNMRLI